MAHHSQEARMRKFPVAFLAVMAALLALHARPAASQSWPVRPVRLIVPFAPGGSSDIAARVFAQRLSERLGQQIVVDNRSSAGGVVGADMLARASPDGYTLGLSNVSSQTASPLIFSGVTYHPVTSFTHIAFIGTVPVVFMVHPNFPARSVADFVRLAKESPGKIDYGSAGNGTVGHVVAEMFKLATGVNLTHVPYRGSAFMFVDLRSNAIPSAFDALAQNTESIKAGLVRALAVSAPARVRMAPDIPTFVELGYPDLIGENWLGVSGPAGVPRPIVERVHREMMMLAKEPDIAGRLEKLAITHRPLSPAEFTDYVARGYARWGPVIKAARITVN
jgi:tripartite-type tricarboxylate transporter receptor subunit TctC